MSNPALMPGPATAGGFLLVIAIILPVIGMLLALALRGPYPEHIALVVMPAGVAVAVVITAELWRARSVLQYFVGGWAPALGVAFRADGLSAVMMLTSALLISGIGLFARAQFPSSLRREARAPSVFWILLLAIWGALNAVFIGGNLLIFMRSRAADLRRGAAGVSGRPSGDHRGCTALSAFRIARFYLLGAVLLYSAYGTLDIAMLSGRIHPEPASWAAISLMTAGLLAKAALYPFHLWLPPAHAGAPAPASAILSGLVVKAPFFLVVRLWFDVMPRMPERAAAQLLGVLGAAAIIFGSVMALCQMRLKLLIAYSTVAQIGYLFLMFPLAIRPETGHPWSTTAWTGGVLQAISHAFAKAAMFMAAGLIAEALGHDRIERLAGAGRALPITVFALGLGGLSLMGLPPSGGFIAKAMLLTAAVSEGQWWWAVVVLAGGLLAGGYVFLVLARALTDPIEPLRLSATVSVRRQVVVLAVALCAILLGFVPLRPWELLQIGRPDLAMIGLR
jgi:formate hydrogenlyase subunit 3/multisubunit Na+/H+ antiporter MnhD subunit